jgi:hypothetical protein
VAVTAAIHAVLPRMRTEDAVCEDNWATLGEERFRACPDVLAVALARWEMRADEI